MANALIGNGDRAYEYYRQINPAAKNDRIDEFEVEPYVYPQNILGDEHPQFGLGRNSWLSGTSSWMYQAGTQYILGAAAHLHRLADRSVHSSANGRALRPRGTSVTRRISSKCRILIGCARV